jgi:hypothetical protein
MVLSDLWETEGITFSATAPRALLDRVGIGCAGGGTTAGEGGIFFAARVDGLASSCGLVAGAFAAG